MIFDFFGGVANLYIGPFQVLVGLVTLTLFALGAAACKLVWLRGQTNTDFRVNLRLVSYLCVIAGLLLWVAKIWSDGEPPLYLYNVLVLGGMCAAAISIIWEPRKLVFSRWWPNRFRGEE